MGRTSLRQGARVLSLLCLVAAGVAGVLVLYPAAERAYAAATRRSTMADMRIWAKAIESYIADHGAAPPNPNGEVTFKKPLVAALLPYLERLRTADWWGFHYLIWTGGGGFESGLARTSPRDYVILSRGKGGQREAWRYDPADPEAGLYETRALDDFENDLILWNGRPVRWPKKIR
jgi:hypothetical protein